MSGALDLEDFDDGPQPAAGSAPIAVGAAPDPLALEASRVEGYEDGYKTGWDDAIRSAEEDARNVSAELSRNLRDLSFTYFEARDDILAAVEPFLAELLETLFPELLAEAVAASIAADLAERVKDRHNGQVRIMISPEDGEVVRRLVGLTEGPEVEIVEEAALASGQAEICSERRDILVEPDTLIARLRAALEPAMPEEEKVQAHG